MDTTTDNRQQCTREGCTLPATSRGYCRADYQWARREGIIVPVRGTGPKCEEEGCSREPKGGQVRCYAHRGLKKAKPPKQRCGFTGCENFKYRGYRYCYTHTSQIRRGQELTPVGMRGRNSKELSCEHSGCKDVPVINGLCRTHFEYTSDPHPDAGRFCPIPWCDEEKRSVKVLCQRHNTYARKFNLLPHEYRDLISGGCNICGGTERMAIDHDHSCCARAGVSCGKCVRGALCGNCNNMLGHGKTAENLRLGADYLDRFMRPE